MTAQRLHISEPPRRVSWDTFANSNIAPRPCSSQELLRYRVQNGHENGTIAVNEDLFPNYNDPQVFPLEGYNLAHNGTCSQLEGTEYRDRHMLSLIPTNPIPAITLHVFMHNLSVLQEKIQHIQAFMQQMENQSTTAMGQQQAAVSSIITELLMTVSAMLLSCQQQLPHDPTLTKKSSHLQQGQPHGFREISNMDVHSTSTLMNSGTHELGMPNNGESAGANENTGLLSEQGLNELHKNSLGTDPIDSSVSFRDVDKNKNKDNLHTDTSYEIIEITAADILAEYTYFCEFCGKGFKRDGNLRMHMRAHGNNYKTLAALAKPVDKSSTQENTMARPRKYSCPYVGCKWNRKHIKFQPMKSMLCVKNHYKRSHCPKIYICNRCNNKTFSVLGDLKTHEKQCGQFKWQCSCGTTFSRKDKLAGHMTVFKGHQQAVQCTEFEGARLVRN
eukprot:Gb_21302 [translate_table: standard]